MDHNPYFITTNGKRSFCDLYTLATVTAIDMTTEAPPNVTAACVLHDDSLLVATPSGIYSINSELSAAVRVLSVPGAASLQMVSAIQQVPSAADETFVLADEGSNNIRLWDKTTASMTVVAGSRDGELGFEDGQRTSARFCKPHSLALLPDGSYAVSDSKSNCIRLLSRDGSVTTLAGGGGNGELGYVDGKGLEARFDWPQGLAVDTDGSILVCDSCNNVIRRVTRDGIVTTVAGNGLAGYVDASGEEASFDCPSDIVADCRGTIVVVDTDNYALRRLTKSGTHYEVSTIYCQNASGGDLFDFSGMHLLTIVLRNNGDLLLWNVDEAKDPAGMLLLSDTGLVRRD